MTAPKPKPEPEPEAAAPHDAELAPPPPKLSVHQAISAVIEALPGIGKDKQMGTGGGGGQSYKYRSIEQIKEALKGYADLGVVYTPWSITEVSTEPTQVGGKPWRRTVIRVRWRIYGPDGSWIQAESSGEGLDNSDKGSNKAMTVAEKQMLLAVFQIADSDDPEHERPEIGEPPKIWTIGEAKGSLVTALATHLGLDPNDPEVTRSDAFRESMREAWGQLSARYPKLGGGPHDPAGTADEVVAFTTEAIAWIDERLRAAAVQSADAPDDESDDAVAE